MRCRTHPSDHGAGVCPCCLRERLSALNAAQAELKAKPSPAILNLVDDGRKPLGIQKFSISSPVWGIPSPKKPESDAIVIKPLVSNSKLLALIIKQWNKNKKKSRHISQDENDFTRGRSRKPRLQPVSGRGMSPVMKEETEDDDRRVCAPLSLRRKAQLPQSPNRLASYVVCLSPMLRPSPGNRRSHRGLEPVIAGDLQRTSNRKWRDVGLAGPDSSPGLGLNRSRKLVDLGKAW